MIGGLIRFVILRVFGARVLLALAALGWLRKQLRGRSSEDADRQSTGGSSDRRLRSARRTS